MSLLDDPSYLSYLSQLEKSKGLPSGLLKNQLQVESNGNPNAVSPAGAQGAFQFMPATAQQYGINPNDPMQAAQGAAQMMSDLSSKYQGDTQSALAAYNWGQGNVDKQGIANAPNETKNYISKIMAGLNPVSTAQAADSQPFPDDNSDLPPFPDDNAPPEKGFLTKATDAAGEINKSMGAFSDIAAQGATLGLGNPVQALAHTLVQGGKDAINGSPLKSFADYYDEGLQQARQREDKTRQDYPTASSLGDAAGFLASFGGAGAEAAGAKGLTALQKYGKAAVDNAKFMVPTMALSALGLINFAGL